MVGLPMTLFAGKVGDTDMGDIEFLAIKEFDGKLVKNDNSVTANGTLATLTASSGKDMYLASSKCSIKMSNTTGTTQGAIVSLTINGTVVEIIRFNQVNNSLSGVSTQWGAYEFKSIGHKVAATQIIKLEVTSFSGTPTVYGFIECFEETTGETPQVPSI